METASEVRVFGVLLALPVQGRGSDEHGVIPSYPVGSERVG